MMILRHPFQQKDHHSSLKSFMDERALRHPPPKTSKDSSHGRTRQNNKFPAKNSGNRREY